MKEVTSQFAGIIRSARFDTEQASGQKIVERCELVLIDGSRLVAYESRTGTKFKYSYQWMNEANQTIYRWDNTTHFPQFNTFPYHRHIGEAEIAEPFQIVSLNEVLEFITDQLATSG
ncbi:DUF6516 family protein [Spirosoma soli]|uniref:DUF6516 family protein n=1 Tax=Spirosoma soli TaxID=1770529 RepID=A0ABW5M479_9BACT